MTAEKRPLAGHRSATSLGLVFGSVLPVTAGSVLLWSALRLPIDGYTFLLLLAVGALAVVAPYAVGWARGVAALLALTVGLRWVEDLLRAEALWWRIPAGALVVAAVGGVTWWSLRLGHVRRPADAKQWQEKHDDTWPYPYA